MVVLTADRLALDERSPLWTRVSDEHASWPPLARGIVDDRLELRRLRDSGPRAATAVVLGNSRGASSLNVGIAQQASPRWTFAKVSHAGLELFEMLAAAERLQPLDADVGILALSEMDLFRDARPRLDTGLCSGSGLGSLVRTAGVRRLVASRRYLLQLTAACSLEAYSVRTVLRRAAIDEWIRFDESVVAGSRRARHPARSSPLGRFFSPAVDTRRQRDATRRAEAERRLLAEAAVAFPHLPERGRRIQAQFAIALERGPHVEHNRRLVERTVDTFLHSGNRVLIVEPPVHSAVRRALDPDLRGDFLRFAEQLTQRDGVELLRLEDSGPFDDSLFADLTHLHHRRGTPRLSKLIARRIRGMGYPDDARRIPSR